MTNPWVERLGTGFKMLKIVVKGRAWGFWDDIVKGLRLDRRLGMKVRADALRLLQRL